MMNENDSTREIMDDELKKEVADTIAGNAQGMYVLTISCCCDSSALT